VHRPCRGKTVILVAGMAWWTDRPGCIQRRRRRTHLPTACLGQTEAQGSASSPAGRRAVGRLIRATPSGSRSAATLPGPGRFGPAPGLTALAVAGSGWFAKTHRLVARSSSRCRAGSRSCSRRHWAAPGSAGRGAGRGGRASLAVRARRHRRRGVWHPGLSVRCPAPVMVCPGGGLGRRGDADRAGCIFRVYLGVHWTTGAFPLGEHQAARARLAWWLRWCSRWRW
jgi:hypothetical protein